METDRTETSPFRAVALGFGVLFLVVSPAQGAASPTITGFTPTSGIAGELVTVSGSDLQSADATPAVQVGTVAAEVTVATSTAVTFMIPPTAITGPISVRTADGTAKSATKLVVIRPPVVAEVWPGRAPVGKVVTLSGKHLASASEVTFNGTPATPIVVVSNTSLRVAVPAGATRGRIVVTNPAGSGQSIAAFRVAPRITSLAPPTAVPGETVTLTGFNLQTGTAGPIVYIAGVKARVMEAAPTSVTVIVKGKAKRRGRVTLTTSDGTATSKTDFVVRKPSRPQPGGFEPAVASVGVTIVVTGTGLSLSSQVTFAGSVTAMATAATWTSLRVVVPAGARSGPIAVTNPVGTGVSTSALLVVTPPVVESRLEKTTSRTGTIVERVVEVRLRAGPGDFHTVVVSDGVLFIEAPLQLHGELVVGEQSVEHFSLRRVLDDAEPYPPADRQFTVTATPASGGAPVVFETTPRTVGSPDHLTVVEFNNPRVTATPTLLPPIIAPADTVAGFVEEPLGALVEVLGCLGAGCSYTSLGVTVLGGPLWSLTGTPLGPGNLVKARARTPGKFVSLDASPVTVLASGQLDAPRVLGPISAGATTIFGLVSSGATVEVFVRTPTETSLGLATVAGVTWVIEAPSPLPPGHEVFAIARSAAFDDSPPSEAVVVAAPAPIARFDLLAVANAVVELVWDAGGITSPISVLRFSASVANADQTLVCLAERDVDAQVPPVPNTVEVLLSAQCAGTGGTQPTAIGRICVGAIDTLGRQTDHCLVFAE